MPSMQFCAIFRYQHWLISVKSSNGYIFVRVFRWWSGSVGNIVDWINEVNQHQDQLVLGWVTIPVCNQPPRSTQPGHPSMGRHNETSKSWDINRHTAQCTSPVSMVLRCKNWCLAEEISAAQWALRLGKDFSFFTFRNATKFQSFLMYSL